jgi:hypothetical protein
MSTEGYDANVGVLINTLNQIYTTEIGSEVISEFINTDNIYSFMITQELRDPGFHPGSGTITLDSWLAESAEITAHELFHAYQHEMGSLESSHFKEVEALLFGAGVARTLDPGYPLFFGGTHGNNFDNTMNLLVRSQSFNQGSFDLAVNLFKSESRVNQTGRYDRIEKIAPGNKQLIHLFYPLIRRR